MEEPVKMLNSFANFMKEVDMFPVFFLADFVIGAIVVRNDSDHLGPKFRQKHPFTLWFCTVITGLSGAFVASFLFGDPILNILQENTLIAFITLIWYAVNYSPFDIVYKVFMHPSILIPACILQECVRVRFIYLGVQTAAMLYPKAPLIIIIAGTIKGNGYGFIKIIERLFRGIWNPRKNEFLELTYFAKSGALGSLIFLLHHYKIFRIPVEHVYLGVIFTFAVGRLILILGDVKDPLARIEAPFCRLLFGSWEEEKIEAVKKESKENHMNGKTNQDISKYNGKTNKYNGKLNQDINKNNVKKRNENLKRNGNKKKD